MFITFKSPFPRILKHPIVARIGIVLILPLILTGTNPVLSQASLGTFSQVNTGSDYYIDVNWSGTPASSGCDCFYTDYFFISEPCCPSNRFYQAPGRNHSTSVYSSSAYGYARFSLAPGTTGYSIAGQLGSEGGITFFNPCDFSCVANTVETTTVSTAALKKVENVSQTLFFNVNSMDVTIGWDVVTDIPENLYRLDILKSNQVVYSTNSKSVTSWPVTGLAFGSNHDYIIRTVYTNGEVHSDKPVTVNVPTPNGLISGKITTGPNGTGSPVGGVTVTAERTSSVQGGNLGVLYTATSDPADGSYEIRDIYYGPTNNTSSSATFKITPSLNNRMFDPSTINKTLTFNVPTQSNVNFEDITSFAVSGTIYQPFENTQCPLANVEVIAFKNGQAVSNPVKTNVQGQYSLTIMDPGTYYIRAKIGDHQFVNDSVQVSVQADVSGIDFVDLDRNILKGYVLAGCQEYIGPAMVTITDSLNCVQKILTTNTGSGYFEVELPSRYYRVEVTSITPNDPDIVVNEVLTQFDVQRITLDSMIQLDFIYRKPLELTILGMPSPSCANVPYPVLKQRLIYSLIIKVTEGPYCLSDTGFVVIANAVSGDINTNVTDTVPITNGYAFYELTAGDPNLLGQHLRNISFLARVGNRNSMPLDKSVVVVGSVQRGNTFVTTSPEIPYMILRDPPGDNSYAFLEQDTTVTVSQSFYGQIGGGVKIWAKAKAGIDIFGLKIWGKIGGSIDISGKTTTTDDFIVELNNTQRFETSNDQLVIGPRGDVFVGAALNLRYAAADELSFDLNNCTLVKDTVLTIDPDNVQTQFVYTEGHIRNTLIPNLKEIIKLTPPTDTMTIFNATRSIAVWEQILNLNNELKEEALASGNTENISFDGSSGPITKSYTRSSTINRTIEFATIIDAQIAAEVGFEFRGSGASAGVTVNFRTEIGGSNANSVTTRTTTGYVFDDDDVGDFISSTVATDPVYGTPVFKSLGGSTRCPWEEGTAKRDYSTIRVLNPIQYGFPGQNELFYTFFLGNQSETGSPGNYELTLTNASNPGALVTSGAQSLATGLQYYGLQPGETTIEVKVARNIGSPLYSFEGLEFCFYPLCDTAQAACTRISSFFKSPCSDIVLGNVADDWLINSTSNNMMNINLSGYDLNTTINEVRLEYAPTGSNSWLPSNIILSKNDLSANPAGTNKVWQTANIPDGQYDIRLRLDCGVSLNYSERRSGRIDRTPPLVYGKQQPLDDDYSPGDEISVLFTEPINCSSLSNNNVMLKMLPQNTLVPAQLVCDDRKITVTPNYDISGMLKQSFEVQITGVKDLYGNQTIGPVVWTFNVGDPDSDMDGISDSQDRCPGSDDYVDTDLGGKPDGCDCLPEISYNDAVLDCIACTSAANTVLDFDGMNDKIEIPKRFGSIVNSFTYEFWVRPLDSLPIGLTEGSSAFATNHLPFVIFPAQGGVYYGNGITTAGIAVGINGLLLMEHTDNYAPNVIVRYTPINGWNHIAVVYNNRQPSIYLNGNLLASSGVSPATMISPSPVIGGDFYNIFGNTDFFRGQIDELRFWDYARTETQINQQLFNQPSSTTPGLEAYYKFEGATAGGNNTSIDSLVDATGKHNGNMINMDKMGSSSNWIHGPITTIADDDGDGVDNGCDVCATGDDKLDLDKDGIPDGCDHCTNIALQIDSNFGALDGTYTSSQKILILPGAIFPAGNNITLKAPSVEMQSDISVPLTTLLTILNEGCVN